MGVPRSGAVVVIHQWYELLFNLKRLDSYLVVRSLVSKSAPAFHAARVSIGTAVVVFKRKRRAV